MNCMTRLAFASPTFRAIEAVCASDGEGTSISVAEEVPVAFRYNGFPYAVMMASPADLHDFVVGFSLTEGVVDGLADIDEIEIVQTIEGIRADVSLTGTGLHRYLAGRRIRRLSGNTSCGLCGVEDLADAAPRNCRVASAAPLDPDVIGATIEALRARQPLSRTTRGAHAAAWISRQGAILAVREDVGRHNALDKLIGARLQKSTELVDGFCLITSRCSFEMVQKAAMAGIGILVSISAPTAFAIRIAQAAGLMLYALAQDGTPMLFASREPP
jgi:FdhD protein